MFFLTRRRLMLLLLFLFLLTIVGCAAVNKAIGDFNYGISDPVVQDDVRSTVNGLAGLLGYLFPNFQHIGSVVGFAVSSVLTFLSGVVIGKRKKRG